jgi:cation transport ATPase
LQTEQVAGALRQVSKLRFGVRLDGLQQLVRPMLVALPAAGLAMGLIAGQFGFEHWAGPVWAAATVPVLLVLLVEIVTSLRRGDVGLDLVAALSMSAALTFGEHLAAVVVALMYAGGQYLENYAERRANREMTALLACLAPRCATGKGASKRWRWKKSSLVNVS